MVEELISTVQVRAVFFQREPVAEILLESDVDIED